MKLYVGITDRAWYEQLSAARPDEVNFWKPGQGGTFGTLQPGELFLFKLHSPNNFIVGGAYFVRFVRMNLSLAWTIFGEKNGVQSQDQFLARVRNYRRGESEADPEIGNIVLTQPFWFDPPNWIPAPSDWPKSTVQGKTYDALDGRGFDLFDQVRSRLASDPGILSVRESQNRYGRAEIKVRLGQGGFHVLVMDAYRRRCAITGESTLPVLQAAHIKPYAKDGPHDLGNGLLLRSDMHTLFDNGLLTVTPDLRLEVSSQIREQYSNGKLYYSYHGQELRSLPANAAERPSREFLQWHNESIFRP